MVKTNGFIKLIVLLCFLYFAHLDIAKGQNIKSYTGQNDFVYTAIGTGEARYLLKGYTLDYNNGICGYLGNLLLPLARKIDYNTLMLDSGFFIRNCSFGQSATTITDVIQECNGRVFKVGSKAQGYLVENDFEQALVISGLSGKLGINGNQIPYFFYSGSRYGSMDFQYNTISSLVHIKDINNSRLDVVQNRFTPDTGLIHITGSKLDQVIISGNRAKRLQMDFVLDTIGDLSSFGKQMEDVGVKEIPQVINFRSSILTNIYIGARKGKVKQIVNFNNCKFLPGGKIDLDQIDTISFTDCNNSGADVRLFGTGDKSKVTVLKIENSDLTNVRFEYDEDFQLYQWPDRYKTISVYEQLMTKFAAEKRQRSYERLDIEYFRYRNNALVNFLAKIWWNYGYEKWYIAIWTIIALLFFTIINISFWKILSKTYKVEPVNDIGNTTSVILRFCKVFVFTSIIFFSLKVDFEKLSFRKTGPMLYFFAIYITGLFCLFFIVKAFLQG